MSNKPGKRAKPLGRPSFEQSDGAAAETFRKQVENIALSRSSAVPLWQQLQDQLETLILRNKLVPKSRIPSEPALCEMFAVSRPVVRSAINALAARGLVIKMPRKGMFIGDPPRESGFVTSNISLFDDMVARGTHVRTRTFDLMRAPADEEERRALQLGENEDVVRLRRVFWVDDMPITYTRMVFPASKVPGLETRDIEGESILGLIRDHYDRRVVRAERNFSATMPSEIACERMGVPADKPLIWIESIGFEQDGTPLEYYRSFYNSDAATIRISVSD